MSNRTDTDKIRDVKPDPSLAYVVLALFLLVAGAAIVFFVRSM